MEIILNQQTTQVPETCSVYELLHLLFPENQQGMAIAVNQAIVPKAEWQQHRLQPHDQVLLIKATQGG